MFGFVGKWLKKFSASILIEIQRGSWVREVRLDELSSKRDGVSHSSFSFRWRFVEEVFGHHFDRGSRGSWVREVRPDDFSSSRDEVSSCSCTFSLEDGSRSFRSAF